MASFVSVIRKIEDTYGDSWVGIGIFVFRW
jgi:hypothetical protein